jgi:hypothetical protein
MAKDHYLGVYLPEHDGEPVALFHPDLPGDHLNLFRRMLNAPTEAVIAPARDFDRNADVAAQFRGAPAAEPEPGSTADPDALLRATIRTRLEEEERVREMEKEVKAEMAEERKAAREREVRG